MTWNKWKGWPNVSSRESLLETTNVMPDLVYRVHWFKAKARQDRWAEERNLLSDEMDWVLAYFRYQARKWEDRRTAISKPSPNDMDIGEPEMSLGAQRGHYCYAFKQEDMWLGFWDIAQDLFCKARAGHPN